MVRTISSPGKGLTAIELLIIIAVITVLVIFTAPLISGTKSDFKQAIEITESSIEQARNTARFYHTDVLMRLETDKQQKLQSITLSIPKMQSDLVLNEVKEEFLLPASIHVTSEDGIIHFDQHGVVESPVLFVFVAGQTGDKSRQLVIR